MLDSNSTMSNSKFSIDSLLDPLPARYVAKTPVPVPMATYHRHTESAGFLSILSRGNYALKAARNFCIYPGGKLIHNLRVSLLLPEGTLAHLYQPQHLCLPLTMQSCTLTCLDTASLSVCLYNNNGYPVYTTKGEILGCFFIEELPNMFVRETRAELVFDEFNMDSMRRQDKREQLLQSHLRQQDEDRALLDQLHATIPVYGDSRPSFAEMEVAALLNEIANEFGNSTAAHSGNASGRQNPVNIFPDCETPPPYSPVSSAASVKDEADEAVVGHADAVAGEVLRYSPPAEAECAAINIDDEVTMIGVDDKIQTGLAVAGAICGQPWAPTTKPEMAAQDEKPDIRGPPTNWAPWNSQLAMFAPIG